MKPPVDEPVFQVPARYRFTENLHIVFWLIKDISWAMLWQPLGVMMILPTIVLAVRITIQTFYIESERYHNLAIVSWITANCSWMIFEFFWPQHDELRYYTAFPFACGIAFIVYYYAVRRPRALRLARSGEAAVVQTPTGSEPSAGILPEAVSHSVASSDFKKT